MMTCRKANTLSGHGTIRNGQARRPMGDLCKFVRKFGANRWMEPICAANTDLAMGAEMRSRGEPVIRPFGCC